MKIEINADLAVVGDKMVHPADVKVYEVKSIQRSVGHRDYLDFGFDGMPTVQIWCSTLVTVIR